MNQSNKRPNRPEEKPHKSHRPANNHENRQKTFKKPRQEYTFNPDIQSRFARIRNHLFYFLCNKHIDYSLSNTEIISRCFGRGFQMNIEQELPMMTEIIENFRAGRCSFTSTEPSATSEESEAPTDG